MTIAIGVVGNILSVVGVVLCNKFIITQGFSYTMVLSACHFAFTWLGCHVLLKLGYFKYKGATIKNLIPVTMVSSLEESHDELTQWVHQSSFMMTREE